MRFVKVPEFRRYPDGRLRISYIPSSPSEIRRVLMKHSLRLGLSSSTRVLISSHPTGTALSASGEDVHGYLLSSDGLEADPDQIDAAFRELMPKGYRLKMEGHHSLDPDISIETKADLVLSDDGRMLRSEMRQIVRSNGGRETVSRNSRWSLGHGGNLINARDRTRGAFCLV